MNKKCRHLIALLPILMMAAFSNISMASHIRPKIQNIALILDSTKGKNTTSDDQESTTSISKKVSLSKEEPGSSRDNTFNQELQWRILNLLAQQLFIDDSQALKNDLFENNWLYSTRTFSVDISSLNPDFYQVKIIDAYLGSETQLEIPRL